jgi:FAD/FMN-containing dehydrogenase
MHPTLHDGHCASKTPPVNYITLTMTEFGYSWGRVFRTQQQRLSMGSRDIVLDAVTAQPPDCAAEANRPTLLPYGNGRSYGDSNLNPGGIVLEMRALNRILEFDAQTGVLRCEAGVLLSEILAHCVPQGWFPMVTPGTQFVTVGGAIANDVHGKNHHRAGSFGNHLLAFELVRSDGARMVCTPTQNANWFTATIGGLGLTGVITWASIQLRRIASPFVKSETIRFHSLEEFFELSAASESDYEYNVSWIDCAFAGRRLGRGLFNRGNHAEADPARTSGRARELDAPRTLRVPFAPPFSLINAFTLKTFNTAYFHRQRANHVQLVQHYRPFFYPLDAILDWNRIYGPRGFYQYQCVVPNGTALTSVRQLLETIAGSGMGSFLAVLKQFGLPPSSGLLSFPQPGTTLALDFPNRGTRLHQLFDALDRIVIEAGGRLYPAKDGRMGSAIFKAGYPRWREFADYVDPRFSSGFWRRVTDQA